MLVHLVDPWRPHLSGERGAWMALPISPCPLAVHWLTGVGTGHGTAMTF